MARLLTYMVAPSASTTTTTGNEESGLLDGDTSPPLPGWTKVNLEEYISQNRPFLAECFVPSKSKPNRQDTLYWFEKKGPHIYQILFQMQMVFTAAYVSLLCLNLLPYMCITAKDQTTLERWGYLIASLLPVYLLLSKYQVAAANLTMACSIGGHRRPQAIAQVTLDGKTEMVIWHLVVLQRLKQAASGGFANLPESSAAIFSERDLGDAGDIFDALDTSGDGHVSAEEIGQLFENLGAKPTKETMDSIVTALDKDKSGTIDKSEFLAFYKSYIVVELDHRGIHDLAANMFAQLDVDGSGEISLSEFKHIIDALEVGFTVDEVGALVNELDEKDNGTISEHEFVHLLLVKHRRLFEHVPLPALE